MKKINIALIFIVINILISKDVAYSRGSLRIPITKETRERCKIFYELEDADKNLTPLPDIKIEQINIILDRMELHFDLRALYREMFEEFIDTVWNLKSGGIHYAFNDDLKILSLYAQAALENEDTMITQSEIAKRSGISQSQIAVRLLRLRKKIANKNPYPLLADHRVELGRNLVAIEEDEIRGLLKYFGFSFAERILKSYIAHVELMHKMGVTKGRTTNEDIISTFLRLAKKRKTSISYEEVAKELNTVYSTIAVHLIELRKRLLKEGWADIFSVDREEDKRLSAAIRMGRTKAVAVAPAPSWVQTVAVGPAPSWVQTVAVAPTLSWVASHTEILPDLPAPRDDKKHREKRPPYLPTPKDDKKHREKRPVTAKKTTMKGVLNFKQYWQMREFVNGDRERLIMGRVKKEKAKIRDLSEFIENKSREDQDDELKGIENALGPRIYIDSSGNRAVNPSRITRETIAKHLVTDREILPWLFKAMNEKYPQYSPCYLIPEEMLEEEANILVWLRKAYRDRHRHRIDKNI